MAIHNPARIPVVAELRRQELLAAARHEHLCRSANPGEATTPTHPAQRRQRAMRSLMANLRMLPLTRGGRRVPSTP